MRFQSLAMAAMLAIAPVVMAQSVPAASDKPPLTLQDALNRAEAGNPALLSRQAQLAGSEGAVAESRALLPFNPQVTLESTRRAVPVTPSRSDTQREWAAGVSQTFEVAGQAGFRREAADAGLQALRREIEDTRLQQRAEVARRFYRVLALQRRVELEERALKTFADAAAAVERRRAAGEDTRLDANLALVEAERARNQLSAVREQLVEARRSLATPLRLASGELPVVSGDLEPVALPYTEQSLLQRAEAQPRLAALAARQLSTESRLRLERAARAPDVTLGLSSGREGAPGSRERLTTLSVTVPLPLFKRNQAAIGTATTEAEQARIERESAERDVPTQVRGLWLQLQSLRERVERFQTDVLPLLARNEELSNRSRQAGQIGLLELLVAQRQVIDARRDLLDALLDYQTTRLTLEAAAGLPAQP